MSEIATIEIDFDIHKRIEMERQSFTESPNDVLRRLLGLGPPTKHETRLENHVGAWSGKGVTLPAGTRLRMEYRGNTHLGEIRDGAWFLEGKPFTSPSAASWRCGSHQGRKQGEPRRLEVLVGKAPKRRRLGFAFVAAQNP